MDNKSNVQEVASEIRELLCQMDAKYRGFLASQFTYVSACIEADVMRLYGRLYVQPGAHAADRSIASCGWLLTCQSSSRVNSHLTGQQHSCRRRGLRLSSGSFRRTQTLAAAATAGAAASRLRGSARLRALQHRPQNRSGRRGMNYHTCNGLA